MRSEKAIDGRCITVISQELLRSGPLAGRKNHDRPSLTAANIVRVGIAGTLSQHVVHLQATGRERPCDEVLPSVRHNQKHDHSKKRGS
ncbi:MAG: hypothetical protein JRH11_15120 [Deltaproteobacteria bacterium]|nr:hypothetical protein [Deltaproteobacteria bacterium]